MKKRAAVKTPSAIATEKSAEVSADRDQLLADPPPSGSASPWSTSSRTA